MGSGIAHVFAQHGWETTLVDVSREALDRVIGAGQVRTLRAGSALFSAGNPCTGFPMLLAGTVRVTKSAPNGREVQLYRDGAYIGSTFWQAQAKDRLVLPFGRDDRVQVSVNRVKNRTGSAGWVKRRMSSVIRFPRWMLREM